VPAQLVSGAAGPQDAGWEQLFSWPAPGGHGFYTGRATRRIVEKRNPLALYGERGTPVFPALPAAPLCGIPIVVLRFGGTISGRCGSNGRTESIPDCHADRLWVAAGSTATTPGSQGSRVGLATSVQPAPDCSDNQLKIGPPLQRVLAPVAAGTGACCQGPAPLSGPHHPQGQSRSRLGSAACIGSDERRMPVSC